MIDLVLKTEASATSRTASINVCDRSPRSYAEVAAQIPEGTLHGISGEDARREAQRRIRGVPPVSHCLPRKGRGERCFRCLAKDHQVKDCREPLKCLECGHWGHCRSSCPHRMSSQRKTGDARQSATGFSACLVGGGTWEHLNMGAYPRGTAIHSSGAGAPRLPSPSLGGHLHPKPIPIGLAFSLGMEAIPFGRREHWMAPATPHRWGSFQPV